MLLKPPRQRRSASPRRATERKTIPAHYRIAQSCFRGAVIAGRRSSLRTYHMYHMSEPNNSPIPSCGFPLSSSDASLGASCFDNGCGDSLRQQASGKHGAFRPDARISIIVTFAYSVALFFVGSWWGMAIFAVSLAAVLVVARTGVLRVLKTAVPLLFILAFTVVAHIPQGIGEGLFYALRILLLALAALVVAFSYDDAQFVRAFSSFGRPLRAFRVPVDDIATMFSIALRFIPVGVDEFKRVAAAQRSRGAPLDEGGAIARMRLWGNVLVPVLVGMFRRASVLAQAMEARCYGAAVRRTSLHDDRLGVPGVAVTILITAVLLLAGVTL